MNNDRFEEYVLRNRDCESALLDKAVAKGLRMAEKDRFDIKKMYSIAAMCAVTAAACLIITFTPVATAAMNYLRANNPVSDQTAEVLSGHIIRYLEKVIIYLGVG